MALELRLASIDDVPYLEPLSCTYDIVEERGLLQGALPILTAIDSRGTTGVLY